MSKPKSSGLSLFDIAVITAVDQTEASVATTANIGSTPGHHLTQLLALYADGSERRNEIADNIVAEFRGVLKANGPNYDGTLYARIIDALIAAERHGAWKEKNF